MDAMDVVSTLSAMAKLVLMDWDAWLEYGEVSSILADLSDAQLTTVIDEIQAAGLMLDEPVEV